MNIPEKIYISIDESGLKKIWSSEKRNDTDFEYKLIQNDIPTNKEKLIFETVIENACSHLFITRQELMKKCNSPDYSTPRMYCYRIMYDLKNIYFPDISLKRFAKYLGFDHATGCAQARKMKEKIDLYIGVKHKYTLLYNKIYNELKTNDLAELNTNQ